MKKIAHGFQLRCRRRRRRCLRVRVALLVGRMVSLSERKSDTLVPVSDTIMAMLILPIHFMVHLEQLTPAIHYKRQLHWAAEMHLKTIWQHRQQHKLHSNYNPICNNLQQQNA